MWPFEMWKEILTPPHTSVTLQAGTIRPFPSAAYQWEQCWQITGLNVSQKHIMLPGQSMLMFICVYIGTTTSTRDSQVILSSYSALPPSGSRPRKHSKSQNALCLTKGRKLVLNSCVWYRIINNISVTDTFAYALLRACTHTHIEKPQRKDVLISGVQVLLMKGVSPIHHRNEGVILHCVHHGLLKVSHLDSRWQRCSIRGVKVGSLWWIKTTKRRKFSHFQAPTTKWNYCTKRTMEEWTLLLLSVQKMNSSLHE